MKTTNRNYIPAAGRNWALPLYDPLVKLLGADRARQVIIDKANLHQARRILDVGCGTGTLAILIKKMFPDADVIGIDPDPDALDIAKRKAMHMNVSVQFDRGFSDDLPYLDDSFDRVISTFMLHHLMQSELAASLHEMGRVIAEKGSLHILDFEKQKTESKNTTGSVTAKDQVKKINSEKLIENLMRNAGFLETKKVLSSSILHGLLPVGYYQASSFRSENVLSENYQTY